MADEHIGLPKPSEQSVIARASDQHKQNCKDWQSGKSPFACNAHHILPVTCFNPIQTKNADSRHYIRRCIMVSKWDINGGNRFSFPKGQNNMIRLPTMGAYTRSYPSKPGGAFRLARYPTNECAHSSRYAEHHLYNREVADYLDKHIWQTLKENKAQHKGEGKDILSLLQKAEKHFRGQLARRGVRSGGTLKAWDRQPDSGWALPFSMAASTGRFKTKRPA